MQFTSIIAILAAASAAFAAPYGSDYGYDSGSDGGNSDYPEVGSGSGSGSGNNNGNGNGNGNSICSSSNQAAACCDTGASGASILGGSCTLTSLLGGNTCSSGSVHCCNTHENGLINVALPCDSIF